jgi:hypothetical protein
MLQLQHLTTRIARRIGPSRQLIEMHWIYVVTNPCRCRCIVRSMPWLSRYRNSTSLNKEIYLRYARRQEDKVTNTLTVTELQGYRNIIMRQEYATNTDRTALLLLICWYQYIESMPRDVVLRMPITPDGVTARHPPQPPSL